MHHWVEGNFTSRCSQCSKSITNITGLSGLRCRWCQRTVISSNNFCHFAFHWIESYCIFTAIVHFLLLIENLDQVSWFLMRLKQLETVWTQFVYFKSHAYCFWTWRAKRLNRNVEHLNESCSWCLPQCVLCFFLRCMIVVGRLWMSSVTSESCDVMCFSHFRFAHKIL